jgi:glutamine synthetase type III
MNIKDIFGSMVFGDSVMKERLPKDTYKALRKTIANGTHLELDIANVVASAMKDWAIEKGATHFTHWFQPMTGITAEKHDSFIIPDGDGRAIMEFSGKSLVKGEPDASSFPSGGLRSTFEARGYTAWDPTSYAFIKDNTLCIPTAFCSYSGEALDKKTPLLRSMQALNKQALRVLKLFGVTDAKRVVSLVGPEQEYFLIDRNIYFKRPDLMYCGRTLFGARPPKGQEMEDHYFGAIKHRVSEFMRELDEELWKLGIFAKTEHNEVAPSQHELAPIYSESNIATDHNQLVMELMKSVAAKHNLACLLHEKPFAGVNGSGKHKFEFRMLGSAFSIAGPIIVLNTIVADVLGQFADILEKSTDFKSDLSALIKKTINDHKRIIFNGNGYDSAWIKEAESRGLSNFKTTPEALPAFITPKSVEMFTRHNVFSEHEIHSRYDILLENYSKTINIEALTIIDMVNKQVIPAVLDYQRELAELILHKKSVSSDLPTGLEEGLLNRLAKLSECLKNRLDNLSQRTIAVREIKDNLEMAKAYREKVFMAMSELRMIVDELETLISSKHWKIPTYAEILNSVV